MNDTTYTHLKKRYNEIYSLKPQNLPGVQYVKTFPFKVFVPLALGVAFVGYMVVGKFIIYLASVLQYGF